jgi:hypothetical protein
VSEVHQGHPAVTELALDPEAVTQRLYLSHRSNYRLPTGAVHNSRFGSFSLHSISSATL